MVEQRQVTPHTAMLSQWFVFQLDWLMSFCSGKCCGWLMQAREGIVEAVDFVEGLFSGTTVFPCPAEWVSVNTERLAHLSREIGTKNTTAAREAVSEALDILLSAFSDQQSMCVL
jgi:NADH:ubiquinone oxidoreductase subunit F (NADH-binding)